MPRAMAGLSGRPRMRHSPALMVEVVRCGGARSHRARAHWPGSEHDHDAPERQPTGRTDRDHQASRHAGRAAPQDADHETHPAQTPFGKADWLVPERRAVNLCGPVPCIDLALSRKQVLAKLTGHEKGGRHYGHGSDRDKQELPQPAWLRHRGFCRPPRRGRG